MNKTIITIVISMLLLAPLTAHAEYREEVSTMEDGYYQCTAYNGGAEIYTVYKGKCIDHQSVVSDNNLILSDGTKAVDHTEFLGLKKTDDTMRFEMVRKTNAMKAIHKARQQKNSLMREYNRIKNLLNNL